MDRLKSLEIKRLLKELDFIESDFEYRSVVVSEADTEFINSINEFLKLHPELKKIYDDKITEKINQSIKKTEEESEKNDIESIDTEVEEIENVEPEEIEETEEEIKNKANISHIKKLYREIVKLTHPDKIKNERLNDLYLKATKYYDDSNKIGIYAVCNELSISYEITNDDISLIYQEIEKYKQKINFMESTYTWKWYQTENEEEKNQILVNYIKLKIQQ